MIIVYIFLSFFKNSFHKNDEIKLVSSRFIVKFNKEGSQ